MTTKKTTAVRPDWENMTIEQRKAYYEVTHAA